MPGAGCTHGPRATKKHAAEPQVQPEQPAFPAQWFYGLYVISPVTGLSCHRRFAIIRLKLSASLGAPGPHDFAVRVMLFVSQHAASIASRSNVRDDREAPLLSEAGRAGAWF